MPVQVFVFEVCLGEVVRRLTDTGIRDLQIHTVQTMEKNNAIPVGKQIIAVNSGSQSDLGRINSVHTFHELLGRSARLLPCTPARAEGEGRSDQIIVGCGLPELIHPLPECNCLHNVIVVARNHANVCRGIDLHRLGYAIIGFPVLAVLTETEPVLSQQGGYLCVGLSDACLEQRKLIGHSFLFFRRIVNRLRFFRQPVRGICIAGGENYCRQCET